MVSLLIASVESPDGFNGIISVTVNSRVAQPYSKSIPFWLSNFIAKAIWCSVWEIYRKFNHAAALVDSTSLAYASSSPQLYETISSSSSSAVQAE